LIRPEFVTLTGVDARTDFDRLRSLSARYPVEWGILFSKNRQGRENRFPDLTSLVLLLEPLLSSPRPPVALSAHICGAYSRNIIERSAPIEIEHFLRGAFVRTQINGYFPDPEVFRADDFAKQIGAAKAIIQCRNRFPNNPRVDWLFDRSGGAGEMPESWDASADASPAFCGYAGGIGPDNVLDILADIERTHPDGKPVWIDMENKVRTEDWFDLDKCEAVLRQVYG
jgi:hypothetical protein